MLYYDAIHQNVAKSVNIYYISVNFYILYIRGWIFPILERINESFGGYMDNSLSENYIYGWNNKIKVY